MAFLTSTLSILPPFWTVLIVSFLMSLVSSLAYKLLTNQTRMKELKDDLKRHQEEMKQFKDNPKKMLEAQKQAMSKNMEYMRHSFKPMLFTFLPVILVFGWMNGAFAFEPIHPGQDFNATVNLNTPANVTIDVPDHIKLINTDKKDLATTFTLRPDSAGQYLMSFSVNGKPYDKDVTISDLHEYSNPIKTFKNADVKTIELSSNKLIVLDIFGWKLGWLGNYIFWSIILSMILRKAMKLY